MSKHIIELENMEFHACHGCYALEQVVGNRFLVNVTIVQIAVLFGMRPAVACRNARIGSKGFDRKKLYDIGYV